MTTPFARLGLDSETILTIKSQSDIQHTRALAMHDQEKATIEDDKEDTRFVGDVGNLVLAGTYMALAEDPDDPEPIPHDVIEIPFVFEYHAPGPLSMGIAAWQFTPMNRMIGPTVIHVQTLPIYKPHTPEHVAVNAAIRVNQERFIEVITRLEEKRERIQAIAQRGNAAQDLGRLVEYLAKEQGK